MQASETRSYFSRNTFALKKTLERGGLLMQPSAWNKGSHSFPYPASNRLYLLDKSWQYPFCRNMQNVILQSMDGGYHHRVKLFDQDNHLAAATLRRYS